MICIPELSFVNFLDYIGTLAFAISGIRLASAKRFDWFGAYVVGLATAIGGGTVRDLLLDAPIFWMHNGIYFIINLLALVLVALFGKIVIRQKNTWFIFDTIGLGMFHGVGKNLKCRIPLLGRHCDGGLDRSWRRCNSRCFLK